jgi:hypothetical protein
MSTKFEQLLDYLVNEEMDKANELFHEIVVEKSRTIYENLIAEGEEGEEEDVEKSYETEGEDDGADPFMSGSPADATDKFGMEIDAKHDGEDDIESGLPIDDEEEPDEEEAMMDIKDAIADLEAAFAELEASHSESSEEDDEEDDEEEEETDEGQWMGEGRRMTREYVDMVPDADYAKGAQHQQGRVLGAGTGDEVSSPKEGSSPVAKLAKVTSSANAKNIAQGEAEGQSNTGTKPGSVNRGITPEKGEKFAKDAMDNSAPGAKAKGYTTSPSGTKGPMKSEPEFQPAGAGTGETMKATGNTRSIESGRK